MTDLYVVDFGGGDDERARREAERAAERSRLRDRYVQHLVAGTGVDEPAARRVMAVLFDHLDSEGRRCDCGCHPRLSAEHDDGFDCRCTWDEARRAEQRKRWEAYWESETAAQLREVDRREEEEIAAWLAGQPCVDATRTTSYAPEQWEGSIDGHSFYFRERGGFWRIELDCRRAAALLSA